MNTKIKIKKEKTKKAKKERNFPVSYTHLTLPTSDLYWSDLNE